MGIISLRPAEPDDEPFLKELYFEVRHAEFENAGLPPEQLQMLLEMQYQMRKRSYDMTYPDARSVIVLSDGDRAGNLLTSTDGEVLHLIDVSILAKFRGRGIGGEVIKRLQDESNRISLMVLNTNLPAFRLYERLGFVVTGSDQIYKSMEWKNA